MDQKEVLKALRHLKVEIGSLACLGCGHENSCSTKGCAVIRAAIEALEGMQTTGDCISRQAAIDRFMPYVHMDEKIPAETVIEELHMFPAVDMQKQAKIELDSMRTAANSLKMHLEKVTAERDAALRDMRQNTKCFICAYLPVDGNMAHCKYYANCGLGYRCWKWRGTQKEVSDNG